MDGMQRISEKYLSIHPVRDINLEKLFAASLDYYSCLKQQQDLLHHTVLSATALKYPPHQPYTKSFLKAIINKLEKNGHEVDEELYLAYTNLLQISSNSNNEVCNEYCYRTYTLRYGRQVTLKETTNLIAEGTTGLRTWQASHVLLDYLLDRPSIIDGRRVLELGAGLGLLGIGLSTSRQPPFLYTLTDLHPTVLDTLEHNVSINLPGSGRTGLDVGDKVVANPARAAATVDVERLDWEDEDQLELWAHKKPYDVILAADVVFDPSLYRPLLRTISSCLNVSLPSKNTISETNSTSEVPDDTGSIAMSSRNESSGGNTLDTHCRTEPESSSNTDAPPSLSNLTLDHENLSPVDMSMKCDSTSQKEPALLNNTRDSTAEAALKEVCSPREERSGDGSQCSSSRSRRPGAILAATVRNEEALDSFLSLLGVYGMSVTDEMERVYQLSPSLPQHRVRVLHIEATSLSR